MLKSLKAKAQDTKTFVKYKVGVAYAVMTATVLVASQNAMAITAPTTGSFAYDLYDVAVNDILNGAPGFVGGLAGVAYSATKLGTNWMLAVLGILGSTAVLQADAITTSLGAVI